MSQKLSSAAVVIGALRVKTSPTQDKVAIGFRPSYKRKHLHARRHIYIWT